MAIKKIDIIGAGPGGLVAAMILAKRGYDVHVYEKADQVGGRNGAIRLDGFTFDIGPTFLMMPFVLEEIFKMCGKKLSDYIELMPLEPMYRLNIGGKDIFIHSDKEKMRAEIKKNFPDEAQGFDLFLKKEAVRYKKLYNCLLKDYSSPARFLHPDFLKAIPILGIGESLFDVLGHYFKDADLRLCFTFQSKYLGMSPWLCPGGFAIIPYVEHKFGIDHVRGGLNRISAGMAKAATDLGAKIHLNSEVKKFQVKNRRIEKIIFKDGKTIDADIVLINADFGHAMSDLFPQGVLKKHTKEKLLKKKFSCSTFMLYLGLDKTYKTPHHNIYFANDYKKNVDEIAVTKKLSDDFSFYLQNACVTDKSLAPEGKSTLYVLVPVPNNASGINWAKQKNAFREKVIDAIEVRSEFKDLRQHIVAEKMITPSDWENERDVFMGATFNLAHNLSQMLYFRPRNKFEELENCYLAGGGTHPGSGLPTIFESGRISANLIDKKFNK